MRYAWERSRQCERRGNVDGEERGVMGRREKRCGRENSPVPCLVVQWMAVILAHGVARPTS